MRKYFFTAITLLFFSLAMNGQEVTWGMVKASIEKNDKDIEHPKKSVNPKTWIERERVYTRLYTYDIAGIYLGMGVQDLELIKGQAKEKKQDGDYTVYVYDRLELYFKGETLQKINRVDELRQDPLLVSADALKKAYEVDEKKKNTEKIVERFNEVKSPAYMRSLGGQYFSEKNYEKSLLYFEKILEINALPYINVIDTALINDCGVVAKIAGDSEKAIKYFTKAASYNYGGSAIYVELYKLKTEKGDTTAALEDLKKGIDANPAEATSLINELINVYITRGNDDLAIDYLNKAIESQPNNPTYLFALGFLYDKKKEVEKAVEYYKKAIEVDSEFADAYLNLGAYYYNTGIEYFNKSNDPKNKNFKKDEDTSKEYYKKALPYLIKVKEIGSDPIVLQRTYDTLKNIYYRIYGADSKEYKSIMAEIKANNY